MIWFIAAARGGGGGGGVGILHVKICWASGFRASSP